MARYRKIDTRIWNDQKFNKLSDDGKLIFFLLLTHPHLISIGAMRATIPGLASELHWSFERFKKAINEILQMNMVCHDENASLMWLPNFLKYNEPESPNVVRSWEALMDYLPECSLKNTLINKIKNTIKGFSDGFQKALPQAFDKGISNQEQEQEQEQEKTSLSKKIKITAPKNDSTYKNNSNPSKNKSNSFKDESINVLEFLNKKTGRNYRAVDANIKLITARLKSGATVEDCHQVIAKKTREWKNDPKKAEYLRPATLFNATKFEQYLGELISVKEYKNEK